MNQLAKPAPNVGSVSVEEAPNRNEIHVDQAVEVEPATAEKATASMPAVPFDPMRDAPQAKPSIDSDPGSISVKSLRGSSGTDFESMAAVLRGAPQKNILKKMLPFFFDERDFVSYGEVVRYVVIKGDCCFVFTEENDTQPLFAIPLDEVRPVMENPSKPDKFSVTISPDATSLAKGEMRTVLLKYHNDGSQAYQFTFDGSKEVSAGKRFFDAVARASSNKEKPMTASVLRANVAGKEASKEQPNIRTNS